MTEQEALRYAQIRIPEEADTLYTHDRDAYVATKRSRFIPRYYIGCGDHCYGNGASWSEAVEELIRSAGKARKAVKALTGGGR